MIHRMAIYMWIFSSFALDAKSAMYGMGYVLFYLIDIIKIITARPTRDIPNIKSLLRSGPYV